MGMLQVLAKRIIRALFAAGMGIACASGCATHDFAPPEQRAAAAPRSAARPTTRRTTNQSLVATRPGEPNPRDEFAAIRHASATIPAADPTDEIASATTGADHTPMAANSLPSESMLSGAHDASYYVRLGLARNPAVLAARQDVAAIDATIPQVTALEDPEVTSTFWPIPANSPQTASGRMPANFMFSQDVPWLAKLDVRGQIATRESRMALARLAQEELRVAEQTRLAFYDLYFYQRALAITRENEELLEELEEYARVRYKSGGSLNDVLNVRIEQEQLRETLIDYETRLRQTQADLAALTHAAPDARPRALATINLPEVPTALEGLYELAIGHQPELHEQLAAVSRERQKQELARLDHYPDMTLGVGWSPITGDESISPVNNGNDNVGFMVGLNLPIYRDRIDAEIREADHRILESTRRLESRRDETFRTVRRFYLAAGAAARKRDLYQDRIVPRAEQALEVSIADYRAAAVDIEQVVNNFQELLTFRIQIARFEADIGRALASLNRAVGCQVAADGAGPAVPPAPPSANAPPAGAPETGRPPRPSRDENESAGASPRDGEVPPDRMRHNSNGDANLPLLEE